jgi:flagellar hook-length control protein FliK
MLSSTQIPSNKPPLPAPAQPAMPSVGPTAGSLNFAQFMAEVPSQPPPSVQPDPVPDEPDSSAEPAAASETAAAAQRRKQGPALAKNPRPAAETAQPAPQAVDAKVRPQEADKNDKASGPSADATDAAEDDHTAGLNEFTQLIGLTPPTPAAMSPQAAAAATPPVGAWAAETPAIKGLRAGHGGDAADAAITPADTDATAAAASKAASASTGERRAAEAPARAADTARAKAVESAADKVAAARSASSDAVQAAPAPGGPTPRAAAAADVATPNFAAMLAQSLPLPGNAPDAAAVATTRQIQAPLDSGAFASELGARVSLLAVDGVQQAELQLNPADMGPVAVQIVVDGSQAQVSFHAAQAETRQALEQSLADLAAALQSQGLTLAGGGVFQQAPKDPKGGDAETSSAGGEGRARSDTGGSVNNSTASAPMRRSVGLLDTFA